MINIKVGVIKLTEGVPDERDNFNDRENGMAFWLNEEDEVRNEKKSK